MIIKSTYLKLKEELEALNDGWFVKKFLHSRDHYDIFKTVEKSFWIFKFKINEHRGVFLEAAKGGWFCCYNEKDAILFNNFKLGDVILYPSDKN